MKTLLINSVCGIGSTGRICTDLAGELINSGHECKIASGRGTVPEQFKDISIRIGSNFDHVVHGMQTRLSDRHGFGSKEATIKFIDWVKEYDPDVIHLHNIHGYYINLPVLFDYIKKENKPVIWTLHDCWPFTGHCTHYDFISCPRWKTGCYSCPQKKRYPGSVGLDNSRVNWSEKRALFTGINNMCLVTPSTWLANEAKKSFLSEYPVFVNPNGIDLNIFHPVESEIRKKYGLENKIIIMAAANVWDDRKGINDIRALSEMLPENMSLVILGMDCKQVKNCGERMIAFPRTESPELLAELYSTADVFVNTTYEDTFSMVNLEALACGTPVISYATGGATEMLSDDCGISLQNRCPEEILRAIPAALKLKGAACVEKAGSFSKTKSTQRYLKLYNDTAFGGKEYNDIYGPTV